jgi:hypothetical protein
MIFLGRDIHVYDNADIGQCACRLESDLDLDLGAQVYACTRDVTLARLPLPLSTSAMCNQHVVYLIVMISHVRLCRRVRQSPRCRG